MRQIPASEARRALWILTVVYTLSFLDRQIISIMAEPIKRELHLADWQLGVLTGLAFAIFYTTASLPVARYADRANRPRLIAVALTIWSLFTAGAAFTTSFAQLVAMRFGVGLGEAGCTPPSHALIVDYFPREKRAGAIGFYNMGISLGTLLGLAVGGLVLDRVGWRTALVVVGLPGVPIAVLVAWLLREPRTHNARSAPRTASLWTIFSHLWEKRAFRWTLLGSSLGSLMAYSLGAFTAAFFLRGHGSELGVLAGRLDAATGFSVGTIGFLGLSLGIATGVSGAAGTLIGGRTTDRFARRGVNAYMLVAALCTVLAIPLFVLVLIIPSAWMALCVFLFANFTLSFGYPAPYAGVQALVTSEMRATASALLAFGINLVGLGLGPLSVGALSDVLFHRGFDTTESLRLALFGACAVGFLGALAAFRASRCYALDAVAD
ncbi:MFS transporter [Sphingomonas glacialis]|uniref:MFS transporter n=2 Tax=Sphingomonas glacialis TaxID=658225 RepID=A0A502G408_9SPHN|nr:MFS transporter [Sphingomonas glacialis]